tara:strand:- start:740 stop:1732 length:993 start_codon:yes stop_codon:yes gene_type:complete
MLYTVSKQSNFTQRDLDYFKNTFDNRHVFLHKLLEKYNKDDIAFVECNSLLSDCLKYIKENKLTSEYKKVIVYMSELYWDTINSSSVINSLLDNNIFIIFNFFTKESPYELKNKSYSSIGSFLDITEHYIKRYTFEKKEPKYNLISKFGRPNNERIKFHNELKDYKLFVYSINNFDYNNDYHTKKVFESEKNLSGDFKSTTLPNEDFESIFSLDIETRLSQYEEAPHLVSCTEKTLKSFLFKRPTINVMQKEAYEYFESFGFIFPNYFGLNHKTEQIQICKKICELSLEDCKSMALEYSYAYETNYKKVMDFLKHHKIKLDNIFYELYHK